MLEPLGNLVKDKALSDALHNIVKKSLIVDWLIHMNKAERRNTVTNVKESGSENLKEKTTAFKHETFC